MQTVASFLIQRRIYLPAPEERMVEVAPGIQVLCHCHWQDDRTKPLTIIIVHGLEGSSESQYMQGVTEKALAAGCLLYTSPSPRDGLLSRMPSSA